jgi:hypothetical protein
MRDVLARMLKRRRNFSLFTLGRRGNQPGTASHRALEKQAHRARRRLA